MISKYARLKKDWILRGWSDIPAAVVNWTNGKRLNLNTRTLYVAQACDGKTDFNSIAFLPIHHAILEKLCQEGIVELCREGDFIDSCQKYRKASNPLRALHWAVTGHCNLNCRHCYMEAPSARYGELPVGEVVKLIDQFEKANVLEVTLTGGEPFVREDLLDILDVLVEKRIRVNRIYSNGTLIHEGILEAIRRRGFSPGFQISFDGCNAHDQMRRTKGIEQSVIKAIQTLCACGFETSVATCIDRLNKDRLLATFDLLNTFDIQFWRITSPQRVGYWRDSSTALSQEEEMEAYLPVLHRWLEEGRPFGLQLGKFFITGMGKRGDSLQPHRMRFTPDSYDCSDLRNRSYLLPDGVLIPCPGFTDANFRKRMPNLFKEELSKVWSQSFLCYIIDMKKGDLLAHNKECERCKIFQDCGLGCRASAVAETGDLMKKDPIACSMWKRGYKQRFLDLGSSAPTG